MQNHRRFRCLHVLWPAVLALASCGEADPQDPFTALPVGQQESAVRPTPGGGDPCGDAKGSTAALEDEVLALVNARRAAGASCGVQIMPPAPPLRNDARLRCAARKHSQDMAQNDFVSHTGSDGSSPFERMLAAGYPAFSIAAENLGGGTSATPQSVVTNWMASSAHCVNLMHASLVDTGVGFAFSRKSRFRNYYTQDFATPAP